MSKRRIPFNRLSLGSRRHRARSCERKRRYPDQVSAMAFAITRVEQGAPPLKNYPCRYCHGWHLAKKKPRRRAAP